MAYPDTEKAVEHVRNAQWLLQLVDLDEFEPAVVAAIRQRLSVVDARLEAAIEQLEPGRARLP